MKEKLILVFTSSHAIAIERQLKKKGIACRLAAVPRGISSDCGTCVIFDAEHTDEVSEFVSRLPFEIEGIRDLE